MHFLGILYLGPQGVLRPEIFALKFLHVLEIDQGYVAHTPSGTGVPPKNLIVKIKNRASNSAY